MDSPLEIDASSSSCSPPDMHSSSSAAQPSDDEMNMDALGDSSQHPLWAEIDMAERYLVSAMFEEAALSASSILHKLCRKTEIEFSGSLMLGVASRDSSKEHGCEVDGQEAHELDDLIEAAGMLLIQVHSENHSADKIFEVLKPFFGCVAEVPPSLLLAGICLQISSGQFLVVRSVLEEFFETWTSRSAREPFSSTVKEAMKTTNFVTEYRQIAELYAVQVLSEGLGLQKLALQWVGQAEIAEEERQNIVEKIENHFLPSNFRQSTNNNKSDPTQEETHTAVPKLMSRTVAVEELENNDTERRNHSVETDLKCTPVRGTVVSKALHLLSPVLMLYSKLCASSPWHVSASHSTWRTYLAFLFGKKLIGGVGTFFFMYALYKQRHSLKRSVRSLTHAINAGLVDMWQLAFNVQLNPLAAVQPFPPVH